MDLIYPRNLRKLFTDRNYELKFLDYLSDQHEQGNTQHAVLFGLRRIGKTLLLKEFIRRTLKSSKNVIPVYIDFEEITSSPENFAVGYIGSIIFWLLTKGSKNPEDYLRLNSLFSIGMSAELPVIRETVNNLHQDLGRPKVNRAELLRMAFNFPEQLSQAIGKKFILILDEFQFIQFLRNYQNMPEPIALFRASLQRQSNLLYILAGSAISVMNKLVSQSQSPIFLQFQKLILRPFGQQDTKNLVHKLLPDLKHESDILHQIHRFSGGNPFYTIQICQRLLQLKALHQQIINIDTVKQAFLIETLSSQGKIYDYCRYIYDTSLQRSKGYGALKSILQIIADDEGINLAEIARRLKVTPPTASEYLRWLLEVDIIFEQDKGYYFLDPVFKYWLNHSTRGIEVDLFPQPREIWGLIKKLDESFQQTSKELGLAIEGKIYQVMRAFRNQKIDRNLFLYYPYEEEKFTLPTFTIVQPNQSIENKMEIDLIAENGEKWAVEIKWKNKTSGVPELRKFYLNSKDVADKFWFISKSGFSQSALEYARKNQIMLSDRASIEAIAERVGVRFAK